MVAVEIEVAAENTGLYFRPLLRSIRGRFEMVKVAEPMAKIEAGNWPLPIPGQRIGIDRGGVGYISEPLHDPAHAPVREKIAKSGSQLEPALTTFEDIHLPTWQFWLKRAVDSGLCRIVSGTLPDVIEGTPKMNPMLADPEPSSADKLTAAIESQNALLTRQCELMTALLTKMTK